MIRLWGAGAIGAVLVVLWLYCILDVIATEEALMRNLPKIVWLIVVIFLPDIGSIAWLALGRPLYAGWQPGGTDARRRPSSVRGPEDDPGFSASRPLVDRDAGPQERLEAWEEDLRRREEKLRRQRGDKPPDPGEEST